MVSTSESPLRILLVDDRVDEVDTVLAALARPDGSAFDSVEVAHDLDAAIERMAQGGVDIVLLELELPDSQGIDTFRRMSAATRDVPIIAFSREGDEETAVQVVRAGAQDFLERHELTTSAVRRSIRYALERHRLMAALRSLSLIDDLTGLYNRRGFTDLGEQYLKLARRSGRGASLVYVDLDRFKSINDQYGHRVGDDALNQAADVLRGTFRGSDLIARMGGDEFAVLAHNSRENPGVLAQRVRDAFEHYNDATLDPYRLEVSVGSARTDGAAYVPLEELVSDADVSMYEEKRRKKGLGGA